MLKVIAISFVCQTAFASLESLQKLYSQLSENATNLMPGSSRSINGVQLQMDSLQEYGCWCYFDELHGMGRGSAVNGYDAACQALHQGITCANMDYEGCDANTQMYDSRVRQDKSSPGGLVVDCEIFNTEAIYGDKYECAIATCYIESAFVNAVLMESLVYEEHPQYSQFSVSAGFNRVDECAGSKAAREHELECCGQFSANTRRPIAIYADEDKKCCEKEDGSFRTYKADLHQCCDGEVKPFGSC